MKKLLLAMSALAALSLLVPSTGVAQPYYNQIGIFTTGCGSGQRQLLRCAGHSRPTS